MIWSFGWVTCLLCWCSRLPVSSVVGPGSDKPEFPPSGKRRCHKSVRVKTSIFDWNCYAVKAVPHECLWEIPNLQSYTLLVKLFTNIWTLTFKTKWYFNLVNTCLMDEHQTSSISLSFGRWRRKRPPRLSLKLASVIEAHDVLVLNRK